MWGGAPKTSSSSPLTPSRGDPRSVHSGRFRGRALERVRELAARLGGAPAAPELPVAASTPITLVWNVTERTPRCFFFSAPGSLGRDDRLGDRAWWSATSSGAATLSFEGGVTFSGTRSGDHVALSRRSNHSQGGRWIVTESIEGTFAGGTLHARYRYQECDGQGRQGCPTRCVLGAAITARPASR